MSNPDTDLDYGGRILLGYHIRSALFLIPACFSDAKLKWPYCHYYYMIMVGKVFI